MSNGSRLVLIALTLLGGCTSVGEVVATGKSSYMITVEGCDGQLLFSASCATTAIKAANEYCQKTGLVATIAHVDESQQWGSPQHGQVQFFCTDEAHQKDSILRPYNGISTQQ